MTRYAEVTGEPIVHIEYYTKLVAFSQAVVFLSMNRAAPDETKAAHLAMLDPVWAVLES